MERGGKAESGEIRYLKEANRKLLQQNHKLLSEMERCSQDLQGARSKVTQHRGLGQRCFTCITLSNDKEFSLILQGGVVVEWLSSGMQSKGSGVPALVLPLRFQRLGISFQVAIWLKYCQSNIKSLKNNQTTNLLFCTIPQNEFISTAFSSLFGI